MGKEKKTWLQRGAHIKERTAGTSNEISFSVLDAAAGKIDESSQDKKGGGLWSAFPLFSFGRKKKVAPTPTKDNVLPLSSDSSANEMRGASVPEIALGPGGSGDPGRYDGAGLTGVGSPASIGGFGPPAEEVAQRKARRKKNNRLTAAFFTVLTLGLISAAGYFLYNEYNNHSEQVSSLEEALNLVIEVDETIIAMDTIIGSPVDDSTAEKVAALNEKMVNAEGVLSRAKRSTQQVKSSLRESADKEAANQAVVAIEAREEMLQVGSQLMNADVAGKSAVDATEQAWELVLASATLSREAAALVAETTNENVEASREKTAEALASLEQAQTLIREVRITYPDGDLEVLDNYVSKRIEASQHALASDAAILVQDRQTAEAENKAYNEADAEATELAMSLPENPIQPVIDAYENETSSLRETYLQARTRAGMADSFLRSYMGTSTQDV